MGDVDGMVDWARSRIAECRRQETKFGAWERKTRNDQPPQALVEAWTERRALQAVVRMLEAAE